MNESKEKTFSAHDPVIHATSSQSLTPSSDDQSGTSRNLQESQESKNRSKERSHQPLTKKLRPRWSTILVCALAFYYRKSRNLKTTQLIGLGGGVEEQSGWSKRILRWIVGLVAILNWRLLHEPANKKTDSGL